MLQQENTFWSSVWLRLKKNKPAMAGLVFILFTLIIATFGYWIAPDNTTNADLQTLEILAKPAGFTQQFLLVKNPNYIDFMDIN